MLLAAPPDQKASVQGQRGVVKRAVYVGNARVLPLGLPKEEALRYGKIAGFAPATGVMQPRGRGIAAERTGSSPGKRPRPAGS
jgi:hypothetical protein